uniref:Uncharacterized protein n=1 Tax=Romanomermis culicivorax TaxID=13658 RepID=A0A915L128_ROMCU
SQSATLITRNKGCGLGINLIKDTDTFGIPIPIYTAPSVETTSAATQPPSPPHSPSLMISPTHVGLPGYGATRPPVSTLAAFSVPPQYVPPGCHVENLPQKILAMLLQERNPPPHM